VDENAWNHSEGTLAPVLLPLQQVFLRPFRTETLATMNYDMAREELVNQALKALADREAVLGSELMRQLERYAYLRAIDDKWKDHLRELDHLRTSIGLQAYAQKDPLLAYKSEAFGMFEEMLKEIDKQTLHFIFHVQVAVAPPQVERTRAEQLSSIHSSPASAFAGGARPAAAGPAPGGPVRVLPPLPGGPGAVRAGGPAPVAGRPGAPGEPPPPPVTVRHAGPKVGRNEPCPCGSGKKYKHCHGAAE
jgi:preprotein translocase subunit SecA